MIEAEIERDAVIEGDNALLIVDDDRPFSTRLARAMESRGYRVTVAESVAEGIAQVDAAPPAFAIYRHAPRRRKRARGDHPAEGAASGSARVSVLTGYGNYRHGGDSREDGRFRLPRQAGGCGRDRCRAQGRPGGGAPIRRRIRCRLIACAGSISSASMNCADATSPRPHAGSTCTRRTLQRILAKRAPR